MLLLLEIPLKRQKQTRYGSEDIIGSGCVRACELERERGRERRWEEKKNEILKVLLCLFVGNNGNLED